MSWLRQVAHVAAKDARMAMPLLAAYLAVGVLSATQIGSGWGTLWGLLLLVLGQLTVALAVQADTPLRDDAFWISRPLSPGAVYVAKLAGLALLVAVAAVAQVLALAQFRLGAAEIARTAAAGALGLAAALAVGVVAASLTRDSRAFILVLVGVLAVWVLAMTLPGAVLGRGGADVVPGTLSRLAAPFLLAAGLALGGWQYLAGRRYRTLALALPALAVAALMSGTGTALESRPADLGALPPALRPAAFATFARRDAADPAPLIQLIGGAPDCEYVLAGARVLLRLPGGGERWYPLPRTGLSQRRPGLPALAGATWAVSPGVLAAREGWTRLSTDFAQGPELPGNATPLRVEGFVEGWQARVADTVALNPGATVPRAGLRLRIVRQTPDGGLDVELAQVGSRQTVPFVLESPRRVQYALLDLDRHLAFPLERRDSRGGSGQIFPWSAAPSEYRTHLQPMYAVAATPPPTRGHLALLLIDWRPEGSFPVSAPVRRAAPPDSAAAAE